MDEELAASLRRLLADESDASAEDLADVLWIARFAGQAQPGSDPVPGPPSPERRPQRPTAPPPASAVAPAPGPSPEDPPLHAALPPGRDDTGRPTNTRAALPVRLGRERASAQMRALARALRPLKRVRNSAERQLDEEATARAAGETALLLPTWKPGQERHFEVDLVIDAGPSMVIWRQLAGELQSLLEGHGAFRVVRTLRLDTVGGSPRLSWSRRAPHGAPQGSVAPERLADPTGRRLILLLTDGMGPQWDSPALDTVLHRWSRTQPVAVLQTLPHRLWHRTRLTTEPVSARSVAQGNATALFRSRQRGRRAHGWVPVLELAPDWVEPWAKVVAGKADGWTPLLAMPVGREASERQPRQSTEPAIGADAEKLVERFRCEASAGAFELAGYLAATPLVLPVMRLVQGAMMPGSNSAHLAEVFLSGLIVPVEGDFGRDDDPDLLLYDFRPGVREVLLGTLTRRESLTVLDVLSQVSGKVARRFGGSLSFRALVPSADADGDWRIPADSAPFARVAAEVLASFGEEHRALSEALTEAVAAPPREERTASESGPVRRSGAGRVIALARAATVSVYPDEDGSPPFCSGFFVAPGWVLTTAEVVPDGARPEVRVGHGGQLFDGTVEWTQPAARYGNVSVSGLALVRLSEPPAHTCVWLTERTLELPPDEVAFAGRIRGQDGEVGVSGRCGVRGRIGAGAALLLGHGAAPYRSAAGGPVVDVSRGEVIGVLGVHRRGEAADLVVPVTELRRESGDLYQHVVRAHDRHHAARRREDSENDTWRDVLGDIGAAGRVLTPDQRIELLGLLAEVPPPASPASVERLVRVLAENRWYTLAPRAWRDGLGLLYDAPGVGRLEAVLRYAVSVATAQESAPASGGVEGKLWAWTRDLADRTGLPRAVRQMLAEEYHGRLRVREPRQTALLEVLSRGWEPDRCDWSVSVRQRDEAPLRLAEGDMVPRAELHARVAAPLAEAFRWCDAPDRPATLEVVLPADLLSMDVDAWRLDSAGAMTLGATRPVVVRCGERPWEPLGMGEVSRWDDERLERWDTLHRRPPVPKVLDPRVHDLASLRALPRETLPVLSHSDDAALRALWQTGHPIVLWRRGRDAATVAPDAFHSGVHSAVEALTGAAELPSMVLALRRELAASREEAQWARGLKLMYDDPTSPPPGYDDLLEAP
ncbi:SAV_2336 N-terminal domain-related protein [Streptomyces sp. NPDC049627]|uniref:SAV_2336 N-terminal domain-related protein n=1 Tax=Streptomyces sp. NPDC049627 TaxID=3365595 RepID=UPI0037B49ACB